MKFSIKCILLCFAICGCHHNPKELLSISGDNIPILHTIDNDSSIIEIYKPYKLILDSIMNEVLCYSPEFLEKSKPESKLSNWMADVCLNTANNIQKSDFCLLNYGGIRSSLPKGEVLIKNIFQLMPFENELVIIEISQSTFEKTIAYLKENPGQPISGIKISIQNDRIYHSLDKKESIYVVTSDYLANGGDQMTFFSDSLSMIKTHLKIRDILLSECENIDTLRTIIDNRFIHD